jgi:hypothetical protein
MAEKSRRGVFVDPDDSRTFFFLQVHGVSSMPFKAHTLEFDKAHPKSLLLQSLLFIQEAPLI